MQKWLLAAAILVISAGCAAKIDNLNSSVNIQQQSLNPAAAPIPQPQLNIDPTIHNVGYLTFNSVKLQGTYAKIKGYMIASEGSYIIFSDEKVDKPNIHDLPVTGDGVNTIQPLHQYVLTGKLIKGGLAAVNNNPYHFELISKPEEVK